MSLSTRFKKFYWDHLRFSWTHRLLTGMLGGTINLIARLKGFYFPAQYIRQWKADMLFGWYEKDTTAWFKKLVKPGMVVLDIGAHIGYFTRLFARRVGSTGQVHAFEADQENYTLLQKNTSRWKWVNTYLVALTDRQGPVDFYRSEEKTGCHSTIKGATEHQQKVTVQGNTLDAILADRGVTKVDFIKMDIEGGEPAAIRGMTTLFKNNPQLVLVTELSLSRLAAGGVTPQAYLQQLASFGFKFHTITLTELIPLDLGNLDLKQIFATSDFVNIYCTRA